MKIISLRNLLAGRGTKGIKLNENIMSFGGPYLPVQRYQSDT